MEPAATAGVTMGVAVITASVFFSVAAVAITAMVLRHRFQHKALNTLQTALERGSELGPALSDVLEMRTDLRRGVISLCRALACVALGTAIQVSPQDPAEAEAVMWILFGLAAFPGFFGLALIGFHLADRRAGR